MKKIELYDIITLEDNTEYAVLKMLQEENKKYCLLAPVDEEEEPDMEAIKIVELKEENNKTVVEEIDEELNKKLAKKFLNLLREGIEENEE
ncbi:MAG: hypothetical protein PUD25_03810 [Bacilli bacterium]|nr:hypothetical protein [Bacilli bacterium]